MGFCKVWINNEEYEVDEERKLMDFLRNDLRLKSVKDGCSEGACGTCTVLIDGRATKACVQKMGRLSNKHIITIEGLSDREKEVFVYAFGESGAVQCGFCIPGMVICAKGLIDVNPSPSEAEIKEAIKNNYCRCTGYKKIIDAISLSARLIRENISPKELLENIKVGSRFHRIDVKGKVLGNGKYVDDLDKVDYPNMIYGSAVRSKYPRAIVKSINIERAKALEGVVCVLTAEDVPGSNKVGHLKQDWDTFIKVGDTTRYLGDSICLVVAESPEILERAKALVEIEYEELKPITSPLDALKADAPLIHSIGNILKEEHLIRGNADEVIEKSRYKVTRHYETPWTEHAFLEPECAVAMPYKNGVFIYSSDQGTYDTRHEVSILLGLPKEDVVVENMLVGGGFGGKEDVTVQHHAALIAYLTKRTVKVKLSRKESLIVHPKRHAMSIDMTTACDEKGYLTAMKAVVISDTGAYASLGGPVLQRACTHAAGPYNYQVIDIDGKAVYTNNPPAGAFRGFGVTQTCFATEMNINELANMVGIDPWQFRYQNAIRPGEVLPNGQIADPSTGLVETLEAVRDIYYTSKYAGIGCAMKNAGIGVGNPDFGRVRLIIEDGRVNIHSAASCIGQGIGTVLVQIVCEAAGLLPEDIVYHNPNTEIAPDSGTTSGSRQTLVTGEAGRRAAKALRRELFKVCGREYSVESSESLYLEGVFIEAERDDIKDIVFNRSELSLLNGREFFGEYYAKTDKMGADLKNPMSHVAYGYATHLVTLDDNGKVDTVYASHDVGRVINPQSLEGQIEGGVVMGLGYALTEKYPLVNCVPTGKFGTLGLFKANNVPKVSSIIVEKSGVDVAYGAIGVGEITSIPTAPAVAGAYARFNGEGECSLPLKNTPYNKR